MIAGQIHMDLTERRHNIGLSPLAPLAAGNRIALAILDSQDSGDVAHWRIA